MIKALKNRNKHVQISMMMLAAFCSGTAFSRSATLENAELIEALKPVEISGIKFSCTEKSLPKINQHMHNYFRELGIGATLVSQQMPDKATLIYTLNTAPKESNTLDFHLRKEFKIKDEVLRLPIKGGKTRAVRTVSKKEILLALLQHGRLTSLSGAACTIDALRDHVAIRQNVVAWTDHLAWGWPDGERAFWNTQFWDSGTPLVKVSLDKALLDTFLQQEKYSIGCYTATKISYSHAVLDYYARVQKKIRTKRPWYDSA